MYGGKKLKGAEVLKNFSDFIFELQNYLVLHLPVLFDFLLLCHRG